MKSRVNNHVSKGSDCVKMQCDHGSGVRKTRANAFKGMLTILLCLVMFMGTFPARSYVNAAGSQESTQTEQKQEKQTDKSTSDSQEQVSSDNGSSAPGPADAGSSAPGTGESGTSGSDREVSGTTGSDSYDGQGNQVSDNADDTDKGSDNDENSAGQIESKAKKSVKAQTLLQASNDPAPSGGYNIYYTPQGKGYANMADIKVTVLDKDKKKIGASPDENTSAGLPADEGWDMRYLHLDDLKEPTYLKFEFNYQFEDWGDDREQMELIVPFAECEDEELNATSQAVAKGESHLVFIYSIEGDGWGQPLHYIDADGNDHVQTDYQVSAYGGVFDDAEGHHWWTVRGYHPISGLTEVRGDINLVLTDTTILDGDSEREVEEKTGMSAPFDKIKRTEYTYGSLYVTQGSTLTIWCQKMRKGTMKYHGARASGASAGSPGIILEQGATLIINGGNISGKGNRFAAGIAVDEKAKLIINNGNVTGVGGECKDTTWPWEEFNTSDRYCGAGIGSNRGGTSGEITINGGNVTASVTGPPGYGAAAIGGAGGGSNGLITINGGKVKATGYNYGAGIGSGPRAPSGPIVINGGYVDATATNGAGIGSGGWADTGSGNNKNGEITITGGHVKAKSGATSKSSSGSGAAIGAGWQSAQGGKITISGGEVEAVVSQRSAAIGGSCTDDNGLAGGEIEITGKDTKVTAVAVSGAGIGSGGRNVGSNSIGAKGASGGHIVIDGATVTAVSSGAGAGIGGGNGGSGGHIEILSGNVTAYGGYSKYNWYENQSGPKGSQGGHSYNNKDFDMTGLVNGDFYSKIADAIIAAIFDDTFAGSGIGGGSHASGGTVEVKGGIVEAFAGNNEAMAIGHGRKSSSNGMLTVYDGSKVTYANYTNAEKGELGTKRIDTSDKRAEKAQTHSYALIDPGDVTVDFEVFGKCEAPASQTIKRGKTATRPADDPAAEGYVFGGWYKDKECTESFKFGFFGDPITKNTTVYAKWLESKPLTLKANWRPDDSAGLPNEIKIDYTLDNVADKEVEETGTHRTVTLNAANNWQATINITEESNLLLDKTEVSGFRNDGYTFEEGICLSRQKLYLRDRADTGVSQDDFDKIIDTVKNGNPVINVDYYKQRIYNVTKKWEVDSGQQGCIPAEIKVVLQHKEDGEWKTVKTITLTGQTSGAAEWTGSFETVDSDGKDPFENWRIRELDKNGNIVLSSSDEGGSEDSAAVFRARPNYVDTDIKFDVSYENDENENRTTITNSSQGTIYAVKVNWVDYAGKPDTITPANVPVTLYQAAGSKGHYNLNEVPVPGTSLILSEANNWQGAFAAVTAGANYQVRERMDAGNSMFTNKVFTSDDNDYGASTAQNRAVYYVKKDGVNTAYQYDVTVEVDEDTHLVTITNKRSALLFVVRAEWVPDGNSNFWANKIYNVTPVLQHRTTDDKGDEVWENVEELSSSTESCSSLTQYNGHTWTRAFTTIPIDENTKEEDYRVREFIRHIYDDSQQDGFPRELISWDTLTFFKLSEGVKQYGGGDKSITGRIILAGDDADNNQNIAPVFYARHYTSKPATGPYKYNETSFNVSYSRASDGTFLMINRQAGILSVQKEWGSETSEVAKPDSITVVLQQNMAASSGGKNWQNIENVELSEDNDWKHDFDAGKYVDEGETFDENNFRIRELGERGIRGGPVLDPGDSDYTGSSDARARYEVKKDGKPVSVTYEAKYKEESGKTTITNTAKAKHVTIEKEWEDIDKEVDLPDSIDVALQKKSAGEWKTEKTVTLKKAEDWKADVVTGEPDESDAKFRVRELNGNDLVDQDGKVVINDVKYTVNYDSKDDSFTVINKQVPNKKTISGTIKWNDADDQDGIRPESITVNLIAEGKSVASKSIKAGSDGSWKYDFDDMPIYKSADSYEKIVYTVEESKTGVLTGKDDDGTYAIKANGDAESGFEITNTHTPRVIEIEASKTWKDEGNQDGIRPKSVTLHLMTGGKETGKLTVRDSDDWKGAFDKVPVYSKGQKIDYTITEDTIDGYETEIAGNADDGFVVTNTHEPETTTVSGTKTWDDNNDQDGKRPDNITLNLLAEGKKVKSLTVTATDNWNWEFADVPVYDGGKKIAYTVSEESVDGYKADITGDAENGFQITNSHTPEMTDISGEKKWEDNNDQDGQRPTGINVHLWADGSEVKSKKVESADGWKWTFTDMPVYAEGKKITYAVTEEPVDNYTVGITGDVESGFIITNRHAPDKTQVYVLKAWSDYDDQEGIRPKDITVKLFANGNDTGKTLTLDQDNGWFGTFDDLDKNAGGQQVKYAVKEEAVDGYKTETTSPDGYDNVFIITNVHETEDVDIPVSKVWEDDSDRDGLRPGAVKVWLLSDGQKIAYKTLTADGGWKATFKDFPKYRKGKEVTYTVEEEENDVITAKDGDETYAWSVSGDAGKGFVLINTHTPKQAEIAGVKYWGDYDDQDGQRPGSIKLHLWADGQEIDSMEVKETDVDKYGGWQWSFGGRPVYARGQKINYQVTEDPIENYTAEIRRSAKGVYTIVNNHDPDKTEIYIFGLWYDESDREGIRPDSATFHLLADGVDTGKTLTLTEASGWFNAFFDVDKNAAGKAITYTVTADVVEKYDTEIAAHEDYDNLFIASNTYEPEYIDISGSKVWEDDDDVDGIRPDSVRIWLLSDGMRLSRREVTADDGWKWSFTDFPIYRNGKAVTYTVEEELTDVITGTDGEGTYAVSISGDAKNGFTVTNTHTNKTTPSPDPDPDPSPDPKPEPTPGIDPVPSTDPDPDPQTEETYYTITYKLNGGTYDGSSADISEEYKSGKTITIHEKPVRDGYTFLYWKGSKYQPGDKYMVKENHTFIAQWKKDKTPTKVPDKNPPASTTTIKTNKGTPSKTGDTGGIEMAFGILIAAAALMIATGRRRKKE